jgi:hypothetical protein
VDDVLYIFSPLDRAEMDELRTTLSQHFKMKHLGAARRFLGIDIDQEDSKRTITLCQTSYIDALLKRYGFEECNARPTPQCVSHVALMKRQLKNSSEPPAGSEWWNKNKEPRDDTYHPQLTLANYASAVGAIGWLANVSRPDLAHAFSIASSSLSDPNHNSLPVVHLTRIFRYLRGTSQLRLTYSHTVTPSRALLSSFSDATWASETKGRSMTGVVLKLAGGAVWWMARRQESVAQSTAESEYIAAHEASRAVAIARRILECIGFNVSAPTPLLTDNQACRSFITADSNSSMRRHIEVRYHKVREHMEKKRIMPVYISSANQQADIFTKPLSDPAFTRLARLILGLANNDEQSPY